MPRVHLINQLASKIVSHIQTGRRDGSIHLAQDDYYGGRHGGCQRIEGLVHRYFIDNRDLSISPESYLDLLYTVNEIVKRKHRRDE